MFQKESICCMGDITLIKKNNKNYTSDGSKVNISGPSKY